MRIKVEISPGELIDKLTILSIKEQRITDGSKLQNIRRESEALRAAAVELSGLAGLAELTDALKVVNEALWDIEIEIREHEAKADFGPRFIELARSVYQTNDRRSAIKRRINDLTGSDIPEEKSYSAYRREGA